MKKFNIIILILICTNFKLSVNQEVGDSLKIFSSIIGEIIINVTQFCLEKNTDVSSCESSIKEGLELIKNMTNFKYDDKYCEDLRKIIYNNANTKQIYVQLTQIILGNLGKQIIIYNWTNGCKVYCREKYNKLFLRIFIPFCEGICLIKNKPKIRLLFLDDIIDKEDVCLYLMELFDADSEYCYEE